MIQGLDQIADIIRLYEIRTELCLQTATNAYRAAIVDLYSSILEYQARMTCHLTDGAAARGFHSITKTGRWTDLLAAITNADQLCQKHEVLINKKAEHERWEEQNKQMQRSVKIQQQIMDALQDFFASRAAEQEDTRQREVLQCLAADYLGHKNFNRRRVPNTCRWFLEDPRFHRWRDSTTSCLLWLSTGPGCGKSVLSRTLIDERLLSSRLTTSTVCYFFFKDGLERRQRGEDALCGILHQLYTQNLASELIHHAYQPFKSYGQGFRSMFDPLWDCFMSTAQDPSSGEVICVLDALDECQLDARKQLLSQLSHLFGNLKTADKPGSCIKFLITSRPNYDIGAGFHLLDSAVNFIQFDGDDRNESISEEINLVIDHRIVEVVPQLEQRSQLLIAEHLKSVQQRTYLWLHLVLEEIADKFSSHTTVKQIKQLVGELPNSVNQAYEGILDRSTDRNDARTILTVILAAKRPFTVDEMTVAVRIQNSQDPRSYEDLDLAPQELRASLLRNICGFFISISDSQVFFIHQTAREFLLKHDQAPHIQPSTSLWHHSIDVREAEYVIAQVCMTLLLFDFFQNSPPWANYHGRWYYFDSEHRETISQHPLLEYASTRWGKSPRNQCLTCSPSLARWLGRSSIHAHLVEEHLPRYYIIWVCYMKMSMANKSQLNTIVHRSP